MGPKREQGCHRGTTLSANKLMNKYTFAMKISKNLPSQRAPESRHWFRKISPAGKTLLPKTVSICNFIKGKNNLLALRAMVCYHSDSYAA